MNWTQAVDIYCERLGPGLWAEPLNAVTNVAFFVAAWLAWPSQVMCMGFPSQANVARTLPA
jgi:hypothetical protein